MENLEYQNEVTALLDEALMYAYKNSAKFATDKVALLAAANTSEADINQFILSTVGSVDDDNRALIVKTVCASARNFILSKVQ
jgi:hypothetical protein